MFEKGLGKSVTPKELSEYLGVNVKLVRQNYKQLGGMRLGYRFIFFEKGVENAIRKEWEMESPSEEERKEKGKDLQDKEGSTGMGEQNTSVRKRMEKTDTVCLIDWAEVYLDSCKKRFVKKTYEEKKATFKRFFNEVDPNMSVTKLVPSTSLLYFENQMDKRSGNASNKDRKHLLAGWNWGRLYMKPRLPKTSPFETPKMPEIRKPRYVPPDTDFWKVFKLTQGQDRVMLSFFLYSACRRGEAFRLKWDDVDFRQKRIRLWTRKRENGTYEYEWLPMIKELEQGLFWWKRACSIKADNVFVCLEKRHFCAEYHGSPFLERRHFMSRICKRAGVKPFGFHAIRHLSATNLYHLGYSVSAIQKILRHKHPSTTEIYLASLGLENVRGALESLSKECNPKIKEEVDYGKIMFGV